MDLLSTLKNSNMEHFFPSGWDLGRMDACCSHQPDEITEPQPFWNEDFRPIECVNADTFAVMLGHEIALEILIAKEHGQRLALILPVGPMGMYKWAVYFLKEWDMDCSHVTGFNMDEWSDQNGTTADPNALGSFQNAMEEAFYGPLGKDTVPEKQRFFATRDQLPHYEEEIESIRSGGGRLVTVYGIGRVFHIAFWEPQFAAEFEDEAQWKKQTYRLGAKLNPLTVEQNALTSFKSRTTQVPAFANTIGPGLFLKSDRMIGGCDGTYDREMMWQAMSLWVALRYGPDIWVPASFVPTLPGKLFFIKELGGPLDAQCN